MSIIDDNNVLMKNLCFYSGNVNWLFINRVLSKINI